MLDCITNSNILRASLEFVSNDDYETIIKNEFKTMCTRFGLHESEMITLVTTLDISLLNNHYDTIWDGLNYYSMVCMNDYKTAYIESLYKTDLMDDRIELLCDDLKEYIKSNSCINLGENRCSTFKDACNVRHDICIKYLLNNPQKHNVKNDIYGNWVCYRNTNIIDYICACDGSLDIVKYLFEIQKKNCTSSAICYASKHGNLDIVKYLFEIQKKDCGINSVDEMCKYGHLSIVAYLFEIQKKDCTTNAIDFASMNGHLDIVKYLFETQKKNCTIKAIEWACHNGHLDVIKYLFEIQNKDCTNNAIKWASSNGRLDIIKYLFETQNKNCTNDVIKWASQNNHLDIVEYAKNMLRIC